MFAAAKVEHSIYVAMLSFGINSGAYVAEIIRAGINAVDRGQMEAGRSLGLPGGKTMRLIILPQACLLYTSLDILKACANHPLTDLSVKQFVSDWESLYGEGKRVYNL